MIPSLYDFFRANQRAATIFGALLVGLMMACAVAPFVRLLEIFWPGWSGTYLVAAAFVFTLEAIYARMALRRMSFPEPEWFAYRLAEWVIILVVLKLLQFVVSGFEGAASELPRWSQNFWTSFFNEEYSISVMVIFFVWMAASFFGEELLVLEDDETLLISEGRGQAVSLRSAARRSLANGILAIGAIMIFLTVLLRSDWRTSWLSLPTLRIGVFNVLLYFILGLALLGLTQFSILRIGWLNENIPLQRRLAGRWLLWSLIFLLFLALVAVVLPTHYAAGLLAFLGMLLAVLAYIISLVGFLLVTPFMLILALLARLFGDTGPTGPAPELPKLPLPPDQTGGQLPWVEVLKMLLFWIIFMTVIFLAVRQYLRDHQETLEALRNLALVRWLRGLWELFSSWVRRVNRSAAAALWAGLARSLRRRASPERVPSSGRFVNPGRMTPRQQVIFYYLAMLRRAGERGVPRRPDQTPYEYSRQLQGKLDQPDQSAAIREDVAGLTESFVEARYSRHPITSEHTSLARQYWERIRRALRNALRGAG